MQGLSDFSHALTNHPTAETHTHNSLNTSPPRALTRVSSSSGNAAPVRVVAKDGCLGEVRPGHGARNGASICVVLGAHDRDLNQAGGALAVPCDGLGQALCTQRQATVRCQGLRKFWGHASGGGAKASGALAVPSLERTDETWGDTIWGVEMIMILQMAPSPSHAMDMGKPYKQEAGTLEMQEWKLL